MGALAAPLPIARPPPPLILSLSKDPPFRFPLSIGSDGEGARPVLSERRESKGLS